ncbi:MAG: tRNA guanosine(34) transglycosylase Tgt [Acidobacteria bacterium]|nr:tRNA guanosine(34) transglycosylase Tgt [Acidobacteriota bacterium]
MAVPRFEVVAECPHTRARAGILHTAHGPIETPVFMPVGTYGSVKALTPRQIGEELGARIVLANTYHLYLRPGHELVRGLGGLHGFMQWDRAVLTDSGGFQVFSLAQFRKIREEGVEFQSHLDGSKHLFTPESTVDVQRALGSDVMMVLDECPEYGVDEAYARESMERTVRWAERAFAHWRANGAREGDPNPEQALFPIVQGGMSASLRRECARRLGELDAPGYAVGGLSVGEPRPLSYEMVEATEDVLPRDRPRYVMGVGMLDELIEYVVRGVDMMDCVLPTRNARNGYFFIQDGEPIQIKNARFAADSRPIDETCGCYCCRGFSRAYLRHLFLSKEILFSVLATIHNVWAYLDTMRRIRHAILVGDLPGRIDRSRTTVKP